MENDEESARQLVRDRIHAAAAARLRSRLTSIAAVFTAGDGTELAERFERSSRDGVRREQQGEDDRDAQSVGAHAHRVVRRVTRRVRRRNRRSALTWALSRCTAFTDETLAPTASVARSARDSLRARARQHFWSRPLRLRIRARRRRAPSLRALSLGACGRHAPRLRRWVSRDLSRYSPGGRAGSPRSRCGDASARRRPDDRGVPRSCFFERSSASRSVVDFRACRTGAPALVHPDRRPPRLTRIPA